MNCFQAPLEISMELDVFNAVWYKVLTILIDIFFMIDILVNFNTSIEISEVMIYDRRIIAVKYLKGRFAVDLISALPLDFIGSLFVPDEDSRAMKLVSVLKLVRMLRLSKMLRAMNVNKDLKGFTKLLKLVF